MFVLCGQRAGPERQASARAHAVSEKSGVARTLVLPETGPAQSQLLWVLAETCCCPFVLPLRASLILTVRPSPNRNLPCDVDRSRTAITYRYERWRALSAGVIEAAGTIFLLLIAVRCYHAGPFAKAMIAGGGSLGLILAPWVVSRVEASGWPVAQARRAHWLPSSRQLSGDGAGPGPAGVRRRLCAGDDHLFRRYPAADADLPGELSERERGRRFARAMMIRIATAALFSDLAGRALSGYLSQFRWLLLIFAGAFAFASFCLGRCPPGR